MLVFIIPLKSLQVSISWELVCKLFERTLRSVCNQTSTKFRVIVVCHERPNIAFNHPHVTYIEVDFPPPAKGYLSAEQDKSRKMFIGLTYACRIKPSHIMFVDADDCISKHLADFVNQNSQHNGWFIGSGYEYQEDIQFMKVRSRNFHFKTNTSHIIKFDLLKPDMNVEIDSIDDNNFLFHKNIVEIMESRKTSLTLLPFKGVVYITNNGENMWTQKKLFWIRVWTKEVSFKDVFTFFGGKIYKYFIAQPLTNSICDEFNLYEYSNIPNSATEPMVKS